MIEKLMTLAVVPLWLTSAAGAVGWVAVIYPLTRIQEALRD